MPTASQTLIQQRARIIEQMREAVKKGDELRALGQSAAEYDVVFDKAEAEERELSKQIDRHRRTEELEKEAAEKHFEKLEERGEKPGASASTEYREAFLTWFRHGAASLSAEERQILKSRKVEERAQSTTNSAGGYLIAPEFMPELERSLKDYSGVMQVARMISTETGANLPWPTIDATARKATLVAENATSTPTDFTFGQKNLDAYMYRDMAAVPLELMQDSAFDIGQFISESFAESFGRGLNEHFTTGTGSGQPNGLVTASVVGHTAASATAFTRTEMVTHLHTVDPAYRRSRTCGWMMNDAVLAAIKKLAVGTSDASPLWQPSMRDGAPDLIEGFPFWINQDMDSALTTGKKIMLFGDYSKYIVRRVLGMAMRRLEERFIDSGQIGFIAFARYDGELINTAAVKHFKLA
jgi:HK97 family phage major capsid protein